MAHPQAFHGTDACFKARLPFFLPVYLVLEDEKVMTVLRRKDAVDHCDRGFEVTAILWQLLAYSKVKVSGGISNWAVCKGSQKAEKYSVVFAVKLLSLECIVSKQSTSYVCFFGRKKVISCRILNTLPLSEEEY